MKTATTQQFRNTVRAVCKRKDVYLSNSWTNGARSAAGTSRRTVGFYCSAANDRLAALIEKELKQQGLTADTRATDAMDGATGPGYGGRYIRGTCVLG